MLKKIIIIFNIYLFLLLSYSHAQNKNSEFVFWNLKQVDSIIENNDKIVILYGYLYCEPFWESFRPLIDFYKEKDSIPVFVIFSYERFSVKNVLTLRRLYESFGHISFAMMENFYAQKPRNPAVFTKYWRNRLKQESYNNQIFNNNITRMPFIDEDISGKKAYIDYSNNRSASLYYLFKDKKIFYTNPQSIDMFEEEVKEKYYEFLNK